MKILYYIEAGKTLGHLKRSIAIGKEIREQNPKTELIFIVNGDYITLLETEGFRCIRTPPITDHIEYAGLMNEKAEGILHEIILQNLPDVLVFDSFFPPILLKDERLQCVKKVLVLRKMEDSEMRHFFHRHYDRLFDKIIVPHSIEEFGRKWKFGAKYIFTGPIIDIRMGKKDMRKKYGVGKKEILILASCGGGGFSFAQDFVKLITKTNPLLQQSIDDLRVVLVTGPLYRQHSDYHHPEQNGLMIIENEDDFLDLMRASDLVISWAGYNTCNELAYLRKPAVLVPVKYFISDNQSERAKWLQSKGVAFVFNDNSPWQLAELIKSIIFRRQFAKMKYAYSKLQFKLGNKKAAASIAQYARKPNFSSEKTALAEANSMKMLRDTSVGFSHNSNYDISVGQACNNNCSYCPLTDMKNGKDLSLQQIMDMLGLLKKQGCNEITLPCNCDIRSDFHEIVSCAKELGFTITLRSNGRMFSYKDNAIATSKVIDKFEIFLNGPKHVHDSICKTDSFEQTLKGIINLVRAGVKTQINVVITRRNLEYLNFVVNLAKSIGAKDVSIIFPMKTDQYIPSIAESYTYIDNAINLGNELGIKISAGPLMGLADLLNGVDLNSESAQVKYEYHPEFTPAKPKSIRLVFSLRCNCKCGHCSLHKITNRKELPFSEIKGIVLKLKRWLGPFQLRLSGEEPFMRKDLLELIQFCTANDIKIGLFTNGTLITKEFVKKVSKLKIFDIAVSLDSASELHDKMRGYSGAWRRVQQSLRLLKIFRIKFQILSIIMKTNLKQIIDLAKYANQNGYPIYFQPLFQPHGEKKDKRWYNKSLLWPDDWHEVVHVLDELINMKKSGATIQNDIWLLERYKRYFTNPVKRTIEYCDSGKANFIIGHNGRVQFCFMKDGIRDIFKDKPEDIWLSPEADSLRKDMSKCRLNCNLAGCHYISRNRPKQVSVIIPTYNRAAMLRTALLSLFAQDYPKDDMEIIVVDDGGNDNTEAMIRKLEPTCDLKYIYWPRTKPYEFGKPGNRAGPARNLGAKYASGQLLLFSDSDIICSPDLICAQMKNIGYEECRIARRLNIKANSDADQILLMLKKGPLEKMHLEKGYRIDQWAMEMNYDISKLKWPWFYAISHNMIMSKQAFEQLDGFSRNFVYWGTEDQEFGYRLFKLGKKITLNKNAVAYHLAHPPEYVDGETFSKIKDVHISMFYKLHLDKEIVECYKTNFNMNF